MAKVKQMEKVTESINRIVESAKIELKRSMELAANRKEYQSAYDFQRVLKILEKDFIKDDKDDITTFTNEIIMKTITLKK